jgi:dTDP-4-amino-4,6-dideoxygalactose transaminase
MSWFVYVIQLGPHLNRRALMATLQERGIPTRPYFSPIHLQPFYVERFGYRRGDFPVAEMLGDTCLALPFSSRMTEAEVEYVCEQVLEAAHAQTDRDRLVFSQRT